MRLSQIVYDASGFVKFRAIIGVDDRLDYTVPNYSSVRFSVYLDDKLVFTSPIFYQHTPPQEISIPIEGTKEIRLEVDDAGHGSPDGNLIWGDNADWADAQFRK